MSKKCKWNKGTIRRADRPEAIPKAVLEATQQASIDFDAAVDDRSVDSIDF